jgi:prepilin-type N-terminal cleavage/methylation domain-containing protein
MSLPKRSDSGFSLIELMVGIFIGAIVLSMVIYVLFSVNSSGVKLLSKSQVSQSTRVAMTQLLKDLGSGQSMLGCVVWDNAKSQKDYQDYLSGSGSYPFGLEAKDCQEFYENGKVVHSAGPNFVCWNKDVTEEGGRIDFSTTPIVACLSRGGVGPDRSYVPGGSPDGYASDPSCEPGSGVSTEEDSLYYYECAPTSPASYSYFVKDDLSNFDIEPDTFRFVLDLAPGAETEAEAAPFRRNLFQYEASSGQAIDESELATPAGIETVNVNLDVAYKSGTNDVDGNPELRVYRFTQNVVLQGARAFAEQGAYGDQFVGE